MKIMNGYEIQTYYPYIPALFTVKILTNKIEIVFNLT